MKKTLKIFLSAMLIIVMTAVMAFAAEDKNVYTVSNGVEFVDQWNKAAKVNGTVKLDRDVNIANEYKLDSNRSLTIDLNGHSIKGVGTDADYIFRILSGSSMTVKDSSEEKNGKILAAKANEDYEEVILVSKGGNLILESGTLQGNEDDDCRLVVVESGTFTMNGGSVSGNKYDGDGAGIYIDEGSFIMNGGNVSDNHCDTRFSCGGGIYFDGSTSSRLFIRGGEIFGNSAYNGGAVYLDDGYSEFTGGRIHGNAAPVASAIEISCTADSIVLAGDLIVTENRSVYSSGESGYGAAVNADYSIFTGYELYFGGRVKIYGNGSVDFEDINGQKGFHIMKDMDTSSENHAWVGLSTSGTVEEYLNYSFVAETQKDYSNCFFACGGYEDAFDYIY